ncbi:MAG: hypothetical protein Q8S84_05045 [bacterium]|nr:hypothetical protein [bacterium]MDP3380861.1 hypothetical protein [bacterium]
MFINLNGNFILLSELINLYIYSNRNTIDIIKSIMNIINFCSLFIFGNVSIHTRITDKNIKNIIV